MKDSEVSALLRGFARQIRNFRFRSADTYVEDMSSIARAMERKASDIMHPSAISAETVALSVGDVFVTGRKGTQRVVVERRRTKLRAA